MLITYTIKMERANPAKMDLPFWKTISQIIYGLKNLSFIAGICFYRVRAGSPTGTNQITGKRGLLLNKIMMDA
jgi:hypothetical protein